jgi:hypothetical protein
LHEEFPKGYIAQVVPKYKLSFLYVQHLQLSDLAKTNELIYLAYEINFENNCIGDCRFRERVLKNL